MNENQGLVSVCAELSINPASAIIGNDITISLQTVDMSGKASYNSV